MKDFNPNDLGIFNGNYYALPYKVDESDIILISIPWDVTTSYRPGTHKGPQAIADASLQIDLFDSNVPKAWEVKIGTLPVDDKIEKLNKKLRKKAEIIIEKLEGGADPEDLEDDLNVINKGSEELNTIVYKSALEQINKGKIVGVVGGDHSVPLGNMKALSEKYEDFGILHIDAHADLRLAYEGFKYSHASIMYNALEELPQISQLTQVGVRDYCQQESDYIDSNSRIRCFTDRELSKNEFDGKNWSAICEDIIGTLPDNVYISFDIDGLSPDLCPNTGTPVPGGLLFQKVDYLLNILKQSDKKIIGFDLCEVAPGKHSDWDANVGARVLFKLCMTAR